MGKRRPKPSERAEQEKKAAQIAAEAKKSAQVAEEVQMQAALDDPHRPVVRDFEIYEGFCEGRSVRQLAKKHGLGKSTVHDICRTVETWLAAKFIVDIRQLRTRIGKGLETIYCEAMAGFKRSRQDEVTTTKTTESGGESGKNQKDTEKRTGQAGSPAFLAQAREALMALAELHGAKAAKKVDLRVRGELRVAGITPDQALRNRISHLQSLIEPHDN